MEKLFSTQNYSLYINNDGEYTLINDNTMFSICSSERLTKIVHFFPSIATTKEYDDFMRKLSCYTNSQKKAYTNLLNEIFKKKNQ